jgi:hypothetical protein
MADSPGGRRFSDQEVALIFKTAAELQAVAPPDGPARGLTLADMEQVAREVGIDAAFIRRAVQEVDASRSRDRAARFLGAPTELVIERVVDGEAGLATHEAVLALLRDATGDLGEVSTVGQLFGWRGRLAKARLDVQVATRAGRTVIRVRTTLAEVVGDSFVAPAVLGGGGAGFLAFAATVSALGAPAALIAGAIAGAGYAGARWYYARRVSQYQSRVSALADTLAERIGGVGSEGGHGVRVVDPTLTPIA